MAYFFLTLEWKNEIAGFPGVLIWQRKYHEHIIRDEVSHAQIAAAIKNNPAQWELDSLFPAGRP